MMTAPVFKASFVDLKPIKTRGVYQFVFEVPVDATDAALDTLGGVPRSDREVWVGIARLAPEKTAGEAPKPASEPKTARRFNDLPLSQQAALRCQDAAFRRFLRNDSEDMYLTADEAAQGIRNLCFVTSRADIKFGTEAGNRWLLIESAFQAWLREPEHVA